MEDVVEMPLLDKQPFDRNIMLPKCLADILDK
jgi:hypothetical protein